MVAINHGPISWGDLQRTKKGHRNYRVTFLVEANSLDDGGLSILSTAGLPSIGSAYNVGNDFDPWAFCSPETTVRFLTPRDRSLFWEVDYLFTTEPLNRCQDNSIENPLDEPQDVSGSFLKLTKEALKDRNGDLILSSSNEQITGLEIPYNMPTVVVTQNVSVLGLPTFVAQVDTVNDSPIWNVAARHVLFANASWQRKLYGTCNYYYTRRFEFEINKDGWDRSDIADAGFKVFDQYTAGGDNAALRAIPGNYVLAKDGKGDNPPEKVLLDGNGNRLTDPTNPVFLPTVELLEESNFFSLGVPSSF